jgi:hypothetical protein
MSLCLADCVEKLEKREAPKISQINASAISAAARRCIDTKVTDRLCGN